MAYTFDVNGSVLTSNAEAIYRLKQTLKLAGWTVKSSSDGLTHNSNGDQISSFGSGANGFNNPLSWFRIRSPSPNTRELVIQRSNDTSTTSYRYRITYSGGSAFNTGSTTQAPSASDGVIIFGGGTEAQPTFADLLDNAGSSTRLYVAAGGVQENSSFAFIQYVAGMSALKCAIIVDVLQYGTFPVGESDPSVLYVSALNQNILTYESMSIIDSTSPLKCWFKKGYAGEAFTTVNAMSIGQGSTLLFPGGSAQNHVPSKDDFMPIIYGRSSSLAAPQGYKGMGTIMNWPGIIRSFGDTYNVASSKDKVAIGHIVLPMNGADLTI